MGNKLMPRGEALRGSAAVVNMRTDAYTEHPGPLLQGDIIVLEINGKLLPRGDGAPGPQWFIVQQSQKDGGSVPLLFMNNPTSLHVARRYKCGWKP